MIGLERFCYQYGSKSVITPVLGGNDTVSENFIIKNLEKKSDIDIENSIVSGDLNYGYSRYQDTVELLSESQQITNVSKSDILVGSSEKYHFSEFAIKNRLPFCFVSSEEIRCFVCFLGENDVQLSSFEISSNTNYFLKIPKGAVFLKYSFIIPQKQQVTLHFVSFDMFDLKSNMIVRSEKKDLYFRFVISEPKGVNVFKKEYLKNLIKEKILKRKQNNTVIFLPSAFVPTADTENENYVMVPFPYYSRGSWNTSLPEDYLVICVSDPLMFLPGCGVGSWMIDLRTGESYASELAETIKKIYSNILPEAEKNITATYGSSMGGFMSLILATLMNADMAFCECPQSNLWTYPPSKKYLTHAGLAESENHQISSVINNASTTKTKFFIHFYGCDLMHIKGFYREYFKIRKDILEKLDIQVVIENDLKNQCTHHVPIPRELAIEKILSFFNSQF